MISTVHQNNNIINDITGNYYILDNRFKSPGKHSLDMTSDDINIIKKKIIQEIIHQLKDNLKLVKSRPSTCLSEIKTKYRSGRIQHFIFDNYQYRSLINDQSYRKIVDIEEVISKIIMKKKMILNPKM